MRGEGSQPAKGKYICIRNLPAAGAFTVGGRFCFWASGREITAENTEFTEFQSESIYFLGRWLGLVEIGDGS
jgi:hypothetical protein